MRTLLFSLTLVLTKVSLAQVGYPATFKGPVQDTYFGTTIADPYRWLEDDNSEATKAWVKDQNAVTAAYLDRIPFRSKVKERLSVLWNYPKYGSPRQEGDYYYGQL